MKKQGISLIVLVITIIVMIILASAIILSINGNNVIDKANEAKILHNIKSAEEVAALAKTEWELGAGKGKDSIKLYVESKLIESGFNIGEGSDSFFVKESGDIIASGFNKIYIGDDGRYAMIPKGFTVSTISTEDTVSEGLVIYSGTKEVSSVDADKNNIIDDQETRDQFVWIPVDNMRDFTRKDGYNGGIIQRYVSDGKSTELNSKLSLKNDPTGEYAEFAAIKESIKKYGGFYVSRYEAGDGEATSKRNKVTPARVVVSRKNAHVYNFVPWGESMSSTKACTINNIKNVAGAVELARGMYDTDEVKSTLIYGSQYDSVLNFIGDVVNPTVSGNKLYIEHSHGMGWFADNAPKSNPQNKTGIDVVGSDGKILNSVKNIYDLSGNVDERSMEVLYDFRVNRGGAYQSNGFYWPASYREGPAVTRANSYTGFRVAMYVK